ncbi:MAG: redoxin domain-containing protein [Chitinophagales bacterium]|nr:redoxin domain-containing protein [Chitinophagales bacterium]
MKASSLFVYFLILFLLHGCEKKIATNNLFDTEVRNIDGENFSFNKLSNNKASVIIFLQPECPFCNSYGKTLRLLDSTFNLQEIKIYGIVAGKNFPDSEIVAYQKKYQLTFPFLLDPDFLLAKKLKATITPQAFLIDNKGNTMYHGMIDNWGYEIGKTRAHATEFYLTDAVNNLLKGNKIVSDSTKAIGCYIQ